jgi:FkbM family methyltransferase
MIRTGLYRPARWLFDRIANRERIRAHEARVELLRTLVPVGSLCFDVGANIGDYTAALLDAGMQVVAVDPQPSALTELRARFAGRPRVEIEPVAIGEVETTASFYIGVHHARSSLVPNWGGDKSSAREITVPVTTLERLIERHGQPYYVKLDVEGFETAAVRGLRRKVELISMEYHLKSMDYHAKLDALDHLQQFGNLSVNVLPESEHFMFRDFSPPDLVTSVFGEVVRQAEAIGAFGFGDIFVKID